MEKNLNKMNKIKNFLPSTGTSRTKKGIKTIREQFSFFTYEVDQLLCLPVPISLTTNC